MQWLLGCRLPTPTNSQTNGDPGEDKQADKQLVVERVPASEPCRRSCGMAENDCDARNQRRSVRQEEQDGDEYRYPDHYPDYEGGRVDRQQIVKGRRAFNNACPVALPVFGRLKDQREREVQYAEQNGRQTQAEKPLAKAGHPGSLQVRTRMGSPPLVATAANS